jgi:hypothetical protein
VPIPTGKPSPGKVETVRRAKHCVPGITTEKMELKRAGILFRNERFIRGWINSIDDILIFDQMFDFNHEIRWNDLYTMVFVHVMDYFLCNLAFVHPFYLERTIQPAILTTKSFDIHRFSTICNIILILIIIIKYARQRCKATERLTRENHFCLYFPGISKRSEDFLRNTKF